MKKGILFDLDGTLLDTLGDLTDSVNYALAQFDCPPRTLEEVRDFIGNGARKLIELSLPGNNVRMRPLQIIRIKINHTLLPLVSQYCCQKLPSPYSRRNA